MTELAPSRRYAAIMVVSAAIILLQIAVTRVLSVVVWYHWAFFSISLAMLGVGAPGVWLSFVQRRERFLGPSLLVSAVMLPAAIIAIVKGAHFFRGSAILFCLACLLPASLALGTSVCVLLLEARGSSIGRMYGFDLLGACTAALVVVPLLWVVPTPVLVGALGFLPLAAYVLAGGRRFGVALLLIAAIAGTIVWGRPYRLYYSKLYPETTATTLPIYERWTPTARLTLFDQRFFAVQENAPFGWGYGNRPPDEPPVQYWLEQDGCAGTPVTRFDGNLDAHRYLLWDITSIAYQVRPPKRVAIVGAGGGRDILTARLTGATDIDAIELNPAIVEIVNDRLRDFSGGVYTLEGVHPIVGEGRSVLSRSAGGYDVIQISLIDSFAATAAGAYSLSENNLYTVEAFRLYWSKLAPGGIISTSRWAPGIQGLELPRLLFLVQEVLRAVGVEDPDRHLVVVQGGDVGSVLLSRSPFSDEELRHIEQIAAERGFLVHLPSRTLPESGRWIEALARRGPSAFDGTSLRLQPPTDDRPFFFQTLSPFRGADAKLVQQHGINGEGVAALRALMIVMSVVTLLFFFLPFVLGKAFPRDAGFWRGSSYFTALGIAFLFVEIPWIQRLILYLDHPSLATTVGLGCILLGAGLGSLVSARLGVARAQRFGFVLPILVLVVNLALSPIFTATLGLAWATRVLITMALIVPVAFFMGFAFPVGMMRFDGPSRPWFWALNGAAGVLASVMSLGLAMEFGFARVGAIGAGVYAVAWMLLGASHARRPQGGVQRTRGS